MVGFCFPYLRRFTELQGVKAFLTKYRAELIVGALVFLALLLKDVF
jgi:hypothetical protein